jgi:2'-5' RNA ligase
MHAIVTILPEEFYRKVQQIWNQLENEFGLQGIRPSRFPHFSWLGAQEYDETVVEKTLSRLARQSHPFVIRTTGLGVFSGINPVLYIPLIKSRQLALFHQKVWNELVAAGSGINPYYHPQIWTPHITLALTDLTQETFGPVVKSLALKTFNWTFDIDNLAHIFISEEGEGGIRTRKNFTGS